MRTVVENNRGLERPYLPPESVEYHTERNFKTKRSCFYDFGAESSIEFSGFVDDKKDRFIKEVGQMFQF